MNEFSMDNECRITEENHLFDSVMEEVENRIPSEKTHTQLMAKNKRNNVLNSDTSIRNPKNRVEMPKKKASKSLNFKRNAPNKVIPTKSRRKALKAKTGKDLSPIKKKKAININKKYGLLTQPKKAATKNKLSKKILKKSQERKNSKK
ncbi:hypothetical protein CDAR_423721 [Caerostris darwini]|uniref:Uncharacterized protein n=1 Tax=Caerostris darwini TaxID=1538125 RepID=A0AAV4NJG9_9ARAC|nr:hypothetical protein CDAR_193181 [Caerostris darwini]GIX93227.1 hypothetical protein CDAR_423721 [Caerostris darwini]